jgi:hypothetical protein
MGFLDTILGRTKAKPPDLDRLFALPSAAITLEAEAGLHPAGAAAVVFKPSTSQAFAEMGTELTDLLALAAKESNSTIEQRDDTYGYRWIVVRDPDLDDQVNTVHLINSTLVERGFGPQLLASVFAFKADNGPVAYLVYLYKRGTFYPFVPTGPERRDTERELQLRGALEGELPVENDLSRWFPIWGVPFP